MELIEILKEGVPVIYISKGLVGNGQRTHIKGYQKGFGARFAWHGGAERGDAERGDALK